MSTVKQFTSQLPQDMLVERIDGRLVVVDERAAYRKSLSQSSSRLRRIIMTAVYRNKIGGDLN